MAWSVSGVIISSVPSGTSPRRDSPKPGRLAWVRPLSWAGRHRIARENGTASKQREPRCRATDDARDDRRPSAHFPPGWMSRYRWKIGK